MLWYSAYLVYHLGDKAHGGNARVRESLFLIKADSAEDAYAVAVSLGQLEARAWALLIDGTPADFQAAGVGRLVPIVFKDDHGADADVRGVTAEYPTRNQGVDDYTSVKFMGVGDLVFIGPELASGTLVDQYEYEMSQSEVAEQVVKRKGNIRTFNPASSEIDPDGAYVRSLHQKYPWYLADQLFVCGAYDRLADRVPVRRRLILIHATTPGEAAQTAVAHASETCPIDCQFEALYNLSLIQGELRDGCELRCSEFEVVDSELQSVCKPKHETKAFSHLSTC